VVYFWVNNGVVSGTADEPMAEEAWPSNFTLLEGPDALLEEVYFDGTEVKEKPPKPGDAYYWSAADLNWLPLFPEPSLDELKRLKLQELSSACQAHILSGFESSALGDPHRYSSEIEDQANLTQANVLAQITQQPIDYVCTDGDGIQKARTHTADQLAQVLIDGGKIKQTLIYRFHELRAEVEAAQDPEAVRDITWSLD
jgi:hypothetical protein